MYEIKVTDEFSGAHNLRHYKGKCEELHGHNWNIEVSVYSKSLGAQGMVMDFKELKDELRDILSKLDHKYLNNLRYFRKNNPTSENIAHFIHSELSKVINKKIKVSVWETGTSCASYYK
ncbi:MAG: 6-carboxytetrahydropterin synthase QueD [Omnitrophica bacterium RBG_13_46_9]|nr:MAG: 6-carboxytetrahydropterin synthase QueD [Omnitrophica bacterium RBG_13_46_9]